MDTSKMALYRKHVEKIIDYSSFLKSQARKQQLRFLTCGSVDDGKSTLLGRLLFDSKKIFEDSFASLQVDSKKYGTHKEKPDLALLVDGLQAEREQGITIDVAYLYFETEQRKFIACDAPGHEQYTRNMVTGASHCDLAIILCDARKGIITQSKRHTFIATLLGIKNIILAVNKMDLVYYKKEIFQDILSDYKKFTDKIGKLEINSVPISALHGDNICFSSTKMNWYKGPSLSYLLENADVSKHKKNKIFRMPVQCINRPNSSFRGYSGSIISGKISVGDKITVSPSLKSSKVKRILHPSGYVKKAFSGSAVTLLIEDDIDISRGDILAKPNSLPEIADQFSAWLIWLHEEQMLPERPYFIRFSNLEATAQITELSYQLDINSLDHHACKTLKLNQIGYCKIALDRSVAFDSYKTNRITGSFVLIDKRTYATVGAGIINFALMRAKNIGWHQMQVNKTFRGKLKNQKPQLIWFTGMSGSGKSTVADLLEQELVQKGYHTYLLDGDNLRHGLNRDLGFTDKDRVENIRRVSEVGKLMVDAGLIVLACFISPFRAERDMARNLFNKDEFVEVYVDTPLKICELRDPKGLYKKARAGILKNFTGIDSPYEVPENPEIILKSAEKSPEELVKEIFNFLKFK